MTREDVDDVVVLIAAASGIFAGFCPSWFTVSSPFFHDQEARDGNVSRIRWGEAAATVIVLGLGVTYSHRGNPAALPAAAIISAIFVGGYEYMISHPAKQTQSAASQAVVGPAVEQTNADSSETLIAGVVAA